MWVSEVPELKFLWAEMRPQGVFKGLTNPSLGRPYSGDHIASAAGPLREMPTRLAEPLNPRLLSRHASGVVERPRAFTSFDPADPVVSSQSSVVS